ncbi:unnamed protein product, partial [Didymodactylos carnosus]
QYDLPTVIIDSEKDVKNDIVLNDEYTTDPRDGNDNSNDNREKTSNAKVEDYKNLQ